MSFINRLIHSMYRICAGIACAMLVQDSGERRSVVRLPANARRLLSPCRLPKHRTNIGRLSTDSLPSLEWCLHGKPMITRCSLEIATSDDVRDSRPTFDGRSTVNLQYFRRLYIYPRGIIGRALNEHRSRIGRSSNAIRPTPAWGAVNWSILYWESADSQTIQTDVSPILDTNRSVGFF